MTPSVHINSLERPQAPINILPGNSSQKAAHEPILNLVAPRTKKNRLKKLERVSLPLCEGRSDKYWF